MSRGLVSVRVAGRQDAAAVARLWEGLLPRPAGEESTEDDAERIALAIDRHSGEVDNRIVVAEVDGHVAGTAYLRVGLFSPLDPDRTMHVSHLHVCSEASSAEVRAALLEAATDWAEERGIATLLAGSAPTDRDTNRFLARLGLGQVGVLRATPVPALRARLLRDRDAATSPRSVSRGARRTGQVVAMRRSQRRSRAGDLAL